MSDENGKFKFISLGQGQGPIATQLMKNGMEKGEWICLQVIIRRAGFEFVAAFNKLSFKNMLDQTSGKLPRNKKIEKLDFVLKVRSTCINPHQKECKNDCFELDFVYLFTKVQFSNFVPDTNLLFLVFRVDLKPFL